MHRLELFFLLEIGNRKRSGPFTQKVIVYVQGQRQLQGSFLCTVGLQQGSHTKNSMCTERRDYRNFGIGIMTAIWLSSHWNTESLLQRYITSRSSFLPRPWQFIAFKPSYFEGCLLPKSVNSSDSTVQRPPVLSTFVYSHLPSPSPKMSGHSAHHFMLQNHTFCLPFIHTTLFWRNPSLCGLKLTT